MCYLRVHVWNAHGSMKKDMSEISPSGIRSAAESYAKGQVQSQMEQFRQLGIMAAWTEESTYRTLGAISCAFLMSGPRSYDADHSYELRQLRVFQKMVEQGTHSTRHQNALECVIDAFIGLIYRHYRPVHYSPSSRSALAEAELEYKDNHVSHSVYVSFDLDLQSDMTPALRDLLKGESKVQLLVWTTTPWTLSANMVCRLI